MRLQREDIHPLQDTCPYFQWLENRDDWVNARLPDGSEAWLREPACMKVKWKVLIGRWSAIFRAQPARPSHLEDDRFLTRVQRSCG
jgi:hypothetical protein